MYFLNSDKICIGSLDFIRCVKFYNLIAYSKEKKHTQNPFFYLDLRLRELFSIYCQKYHQKPTEF